MTYINSRQTFHITDLVVVRQRQICDTADLLFSLSLRVPEVFVNELCSQSSLCPLQRCRISLGWDAAAVCQCRAVRTRQFRKEVKMKE